MKANNIYDFITQQENNFKFPIPVIDGWDWNFLEHVKVSTLYKNGQLESGKNKGTLDEKPVKNIVSPILDLRYRAEDIDVKDINLYVDDPEIYHLSFLIKKYHDDVFVVENDFDTYFDELKESKIDFGGALAKDVGGDKPDIVHLQSIAFCDQTDILSGPIGIKHEYSPDQLKEFESKGWKNIDAVIALACEEKTLENGQKVSTPGRYIEVYEVHGMFPESFLDENGNPDKFSRQLHIVTFYQGADQKKGITLYSGKERKNPFKFIPSHKNIFGRALGVGGVEELSEAQIWTNYDMIRMKELLDAASKIVMLTDNPDLAAKHPSGLKGMGSMEIIETTQGTKGLWQADNYPRTLTLFDRASQEWEEYAKGVGFAQDPMVGKPAPSGTPFRAQERQVIEGKSTHEYRRGKFAKRIEEQYRDWFIPRIIKKITEGVRFLSELSLEEMQMLAEKITTKAANKMVKERVLKGLDVTQDEIELHKEMVRKEFMKDNKKFIEIVKDELKNAPIRVKINVAGKQKDISLMADKLGDIFRQIIANPQGFLQVMQIPQAAKSFNQMLELAGMSPLDYGAKPDIPMQPMQPQTPQPQPAQ